MELVAQLAGPIIETFGGLVKWQRSTQMCTPQSHAFLYVLLASWGVIAVAGIQLWRKVIRTSPKAVPV
ncbi:hypothetical protein CBP36_21300 (plasmid) [Acidovorax carolinensis]|uniref:Uncharacterized protein n=1 Tax=Acidovorax carolinensis TaxID=553814 RepID=A0A240UK57_9BURK|nr:hypothetical protein CBP36_21300 [Acidovorax carolinensis]